MNYHCQICEREIKARKGVIAHHGYTRPYPQEQTSSCRGARELPYEVSRDAIPAVIEWEELFLKNQHQRYRQLMDNPPETISGPFNPYRPARVYSRPEGFDSIANMEQGSWNGGYDYEHYATVRQVLRNTDAARREIKRLTARYDNWIKVG